MKTKKMKLTDDEVKLLEAYSEQKSSNFFVKTTTELLFDNPRIFVTITSKPVSDDDLLDWIKRVRGCENKTKSGMGIKCVIRKGFYDPRTD